MSAPIAFCGDTHAFAQLLAQAHDAAVAGGACALIQVGDLGVYETSRPQFERAAALFTIPVYFIDGNHEDYRLMRGWQERGVPVEWVPGLTWVPRGYVMEIGGRRVGFLGGAGSIDKAWRTEGVSWFPEEQLTENQVKRLVGEVLVGGYVDILVTHTPPQTVVDRNFPAEGKLLFGVGLDWLDPSAHKVELARFLLDEPPTVCGHMHKSVTDGNVRILDAGETILL